MQLLQLPIQGCWIIPKKININPFHNLTLYVYVRQGTGLYLVFGLEEAVDVVEAVEDEADGGRRHLVVAAKVGRRRVAGGVGEDPAA